MGRDRSRRWMAPAESSSASRGALATSRALLPSSRPRWSLALGRQSMPRATTAFNWPVTSATTSRSKPWAWDTWGGGGWVDTRSHRGGEYGVLGLGRHNDTTTQRHSGTGVVVHLRTCSPLSPPPRPLPARRTHWGGFTAGLIRLEGSMLGAVVFAGAGAGAGPGVPPAPSPVVVTPISPCSRRCPVTTETKSFASAASALAARAASAALAR